MKKISAILMCIVLLACIAACKGEGMDDTTVTPSATQTSAVDVTTAHTSAATVTENGTSDTEQTTVTSNSTSATITFGDIVLPKLEF